MITAEDAYRGLMSVSQSTIKAIYEKLQIDGNTRKWNVTNAINPPSVIITDRDASEEEGTYIAFPNKEEFSLEMLVDYDRESDADIEYAIKVMYIPPDRKFKRVFICITWDEVQHVYRTLVKLSFIRIGVF